MFSANYNIMYSAVSFLYNGPTENTFFPFMQACDSLQVEFTHFLLHWIFQTKNCVTIVQLQGRITASVSMQMKVTHTTQPSSCSSLQLIFLFCELREVVNKKNGYFTVRLTVRVDPPPLRSAVLCFFLRWTFDFCFWLYMIWNKFWQKKMFFDPLYDPLVVWRWAFQIEANTTTEPRMQWREVH